MRKIQYFKILFKKIEAEIQYLVLAFVEGGMLIRIKTDLSIFKTL